MPGKAYGEELGVSNSGSIDSYVRVILTKSWTDTKGNKDTELSLILLIYILLKVMDGLLMKLLRLRSVQFFIIQELYRQEKVPRILQIR